MAPEQGAWGRVGRSWEFQGSTLKGSIDEKRDHLSERFSDHGVEQRYLRGQEGSSGRWWGYPGLRWSGWKW